uniref:Uncharacterized protein n=1 Tax=Mammaliicoccus fleurettii TaxID=150056 RepID=A0A0D6DTR5_9STAP|nr:putative protein [Mammaliicoccus fleurettii]
MILLYFFNLSMQINANFRGVFNDSISQRKPTFLNIFRCFHLYKKKGGITWLIQVKGNGTPKNY